MSSDEIYMNRCLQLAQLAAGNVAPNPMVGAVLVHNDTILGEGWHQQYGKPHAEVKCLQNVAESSRHLIDKSTLYVSLEPCAHFGKTPPCTDLIIANKIPRVVIGCMDYHAVVNGKGIEKLRAAGVEVTFGVMEKKALQLNQRFFTFQQKRRPYIVLKWAQSLDGKIAKNDHKRVLITNDYTNRIVHKWRSEEAAIMIGTNTALYDNPNLTARLWPGKNPARVFLDSYLKIPSTHHLMDGIVKTIVFNSKKEAIENDLVFHKINFGSQFLQSMLRKLYSHNLQSVLVEGGAQLLQSFIDAGLWDEARVITNESMVIGDGLSAPVLSSHQLIETNNYLSDHIRTYKRAAVNE